MSIETIILAIGVLAFCVSVITEVAMYGWEKMTELWGRFKGGE